jgi:hypothetical protein
LVRWLEGGNWRAQEPDHWCGTCAIGQRLEERLAPYTVDGDQRLIDKRFNEIVRGLR